MRGLELKKIVEICWKNSPTNEEKFPINPKNCKSTTDNGSITMDRTLSADDIYRTNGKKYVNDSSSIESRKEEVPEKMSLLRKLCFFLSLNGGVLYFLVLAWLLPCRWAPCSISDDVWTANFSNIRITTNMETSPMKDPSLLIFGYVDGEGNKMSALRMTDGKQIWNQTLLEEPSHITCNFGKYVSRHKTSCFVVAKNSIAAFNLENGDLIWEQKKTSTQGIGDLALNQEDGKTYLIGISSDHMSLFDFENGTEVSAISLPCSWTNNVKIAGPWKTKHGLIRVLVCQYEDAIEVYTFEDKDMLKFSKTNLNDYRDIKFNRIVSQQSYSGSIDLVGDVTISPNSLVLSWADMVTMVTAQAPSHHFHKTWERRFSNGSTVGVTSVALGKFITSKTLHIAASVLTDGKSSIHILDSQNGSTVFKWELEAKKIILMKRIRGAQKESDFLLLESSDITNISNADSDLFGSRNFYTLHYEDGEVVLRHIATVDNFIASSFSPMSDGKSSLLVSSTNQNGDVIFDRYIIQNKDPETNWCKDEKKDASNSSSVMFFE